MQADVRYYSDKCSLVEYIKDIPAKRTKSTRSMEDVYTFETIYYMEFIWRIANSIYECILWHGKS